METLGAFLRKHRRAIDMKQEDAAHAVGVSRGTLSMWENDKNSPPVDVFARLLSLLEVPPIKWHAALCCAARTDYPRTEATT